MRRWHGLAAFAFGAIIIGGGVASAATSVSANPDRSPGIVTSARTELTRLARFTGLDDEAAVAPGTLDDGKDLVSKAGISIDDAVKAAQGAAQGAVGEVDLEYYQGTLVFNVDIGNHDVKVDASTGAVVATDQDD